MGSQDGLVHLPMVYANPGDIILVPDRDIQLMKQEFKWPVQHLTICL